MAQQEGQCKNYDLCGIAARHETVSADKSAFICPECGGPLRAVLSGSGQPRRPLKWLGLIAAAGIAASGWAAFGPSLWAPQPADGDTNPPLLTETRLSSPGPTGPSLRPVGCSPAPLLMPGKRTLFQRVLTRPDAILTTNPGEPTGQALPPLLTFYVYQRRMVGGEGWVEVGPDAGCHTTGWIKEERTVAWKQQIVVTFDNPAGRNRVMLLKDAGDVSKIAALPQPGLELGRMIGAVQSGRPDPRVVAAEPENYLDFKRNFYLLPIVDFTETIVKGQRVHLLKVHSIAEESVPSSVPPLVKAAVVFVIDSTISMGKYIERTKEAVRQIYKHLSNSPGGHEIRFGLVAFRSDTRKHPIELEYVAKLFVDPNTDNSAAEFEAGIAQVRAASVPTERFDEDAYAGIMLALQSIDWSPYLARHIVLISDAGALDATDPLSKTGQSAKDVAAIARFRDIYLYTIHLKTPEGLTLQNHLKAAQQYQQLTESALTSGSLYYPVEHAEDVANFGPWIDCAVRGMTHTIRTVGEAPDPARRAAVELCPEGGTKVTQMRKDAELIGHALHLKYLGLTPAGQTPLSDFAGWIWDHDLERPVRPTVEIRVLLTKNQLSNLANGVRRILEAAKSGRTNSDQFHRSLVDFSSAMGHDAALAKPVEDLTIADLGILGEFVDDLPYKSVIMNISQEAWENMSDSEQDDHIRAIENKLERYGIYEADCTSWVDLANPQRDRSSGCDAVASDDGELVYPVPLDALP